MAEMLAQKQTIKKMLLSSNLLGTSLLYCYNDGSYSCVCTGDSAVAHLAEALQVNTGLEMLLIADNPFGDEGGQQLTSVLCRTNRTLQVLDLHGTHMTRTVEREVCKLLAVQLITV